MGVQTVTVMFTDLVDSTALLSRLGEERGEAVRREHFALLRQAIEPSGGREVKNLGDGLMVVFASAADAVAAAVAVQRAFDRRNRRAAERLLIRVGVASGDVDVEDGDYFGVPVVEAARLCAAADGGEILTTEMVRLLTGTRGGHRFTALGELDLKGLDAPVAAHRTEWQADDAASDRPPLPARLAAARSAVFVGREAEHLRLTTVWKAVDTAGEPHLMLLSGEPGIGKTTLSARFATEVHDAGAVVVYGRCDEELRIPYQPWVEALTQLVGWLPDDVLADHVTQRGASLARLVPQVASRLDLELAAPGDGDGERFVLMACVADVLARASEERPVLVVLDDLHWADQPTVQLVRHLATAAQQMRVGILGTFRDSDVGSGHPMTDLLALLHRDGRSERIALAGFSDVELLALLETIAGHEMTADGVALRDAVLAETGGNPFFTVEVLRHLADTGAISQGDDGRWVATVDLTEAGLPISVKEVVQRRLAGLGAATERVLALASVIGRDFDVPLLAAVADVDEDDLVDLCDAAVAAAVLDVTDVADRYTFAHALIGHTLHDTLSPSRRARAHRKVAEALEAVVGAHPGERAGELARHWSAAVAPTDATKAIHYTALAGARALEQLAPDEALRWYTEALELLDRHGGDDRQRAQILVGLGTARRQCGIAEHRETLLEAAWLADRIDAIDLLAQAALANSRGYFSSVGHADEQRLAVLDRALERLGDGDLGQRALLLALGAVERTYGSDLHERLAIAEEAIDTARRHANPAVIARTLVIAIAATYGPSTHLRHTEWCREQRSIAEQLGDPILREIAAGYSMWQALKSGDRDLYLGCGGICDALSVHVPDAERRWAHQREVATRSMVAGDLEQAESAATAAWVLGEEIGQPDASTMFAGQLANVRDHQGRLHELINEIEQTLADQPGLPVYRAVLAYACARGDRPERAAELLTADRATGFDIPEDTAWTTAQSLWAHTVALLGDVAAGEILHHRLSPYADQIVTTNITVHCSIAHYLGLLDHLLGRHDDADQWFHQAMDIHQGIDSPLFMAYTDAAWAALLADRDRGDDHARARTLAQRALEVSTTRGYGYIQRDAAAVLDRLG